MNNVLKAEIERLQPYGEEIEEILNDNTMSFREAIDLSFLVLNSIPTSHSIPSKDLWCMAIQRVESKNIKEIRSEIGLLTMLIPEFASDNQINIHSLLLKIDPIENFELTKVYSDEDRKTIKNGIKLLALKKLA